MVLKNSYIFLYKSNKKKNVKNEKDVIVLNIPTRINSYIKKTFNISKEIEEIKFFKYTLESTININDKFFNVTFIIHRVVESTYLDVQVEGKTKLQTVQCLEHIQNMLVSSGIENEYITIISYDSISEYYCNKIYPKLNLLERNLRKLLFNIYIVNFGKEYYEATISDDLQNKAKKIIKAKGNEEKKKEERLKKFFYSLEFGDIQNLLFTSTWTDFDEEKKKDFLNNHSDLSQLSDEELRISFSQFTPRSDWERFFNNKIKEDINIENMIESIRIDRNNIAHCKFFTSRQYIKCNKIIMKFNQTILSAISITEEKEFAEKNRESINKSISSISETFKRFQENLIKSIVPLIEITKEYNRTIEPLRKTFENILKPLRNANKINLSNLQNDISKFKGNDLFYLKNTNDTTKDKT